MNEYKYKLSIIIPMYNAEKYIANCLDSILNSDLPKDCYEVIIVNDGSTDNGSEIAQKYVSRHSNLVYLCQENQGQSVARNYGIREAHGEYIWCVDADDKVDSSLFPVYQGLESHPMIDIFAFQLKEETENGEFVRLECTQPSVVHGRVISGRDAIVNGYAPSSVCALLVRRQMMIDYGLFFKEGITQQDVELSYRLLAHASEVYFSDFKPYIYIHHSGSTSKATDIKKRIKYECDKVEIVKSFRNLSFFFESSDEELSNHIRKYADGALFGIVYNMCKNRKEFKSVGISKAVLEKLKDEGLYPLIGPFDSWKKRLVSIVLNKEIFVS